MNLVTILLMMYIFVQLDAPAWCYGCLIAEFILNAVKTIRSYRQLEIMKECIEMLQYTESQLEEENDDNSGDTRGTE